MRRTKVLRESIHATDEVPIQTSLSVFPFVAPRLPEPKRALCNFDVPGHLRRNTKVEERLTLSGVLRRILAAEASNARNCGVRTTGASLRFLWGEEACKPLGLFGVGSPWRQSDGQSLHCQVTGFVPTRKPITVGAWILRRDPNP